MLREALPVILSDGLWLLIAAGWILLITIGLEVDKPLSGGIPGHISADDGQAQVLNEGFWGRMGVVGSWIVFGLATVSLPVILYWILTAHST